MEEDPADHPVQVDEQHGEQPHAHDRGQAPHHSPDQHAGVGQDADDAHDPQQADEPQQGRVLAQAWSEGGRDRDEVEHVPAVTEEVLGPASVRGDADRQLDHEDAQAGIVEDGQQPSNLAIDGVVGLEAEHDRVGDDDAEDERLEP
jgi:hypothetical protein